MSLPISLPCLQPFHKWFVLLFWWFQRRLEHRTNKRFKADSQRVAFVVCGKFSDLGGVREHRIALLTT
ncbi:hypothetical protein CGK63_04035 [Vibrio parahaemolyticus]|nr:hypothetical protein D5E73_24700 [Vibrio parahaemolyticus]TBT71004.1 hypothetical protein D5E72_24645 [Vibrio parahaemolyticus]TNY78068.1 hypothetical protein CGK63_04035 [Vibrio parahaemolyticus]TOK94608.1 hypothetical protein CGI06_25085 [Vibrio parahaemolyticus]TOQ33058.1 hypothetical protein CGG98_24280 [Vibrio parahaemolyticus]